MGKLVQPAWLSGTGGLDRSSDPKANVEKRRFVVRRFVVRDLWSDGTGTLLEVVNRPPLF
jgi:hypothetical protein